MSVLIEVGVKNKVVQEIPPEMDLVLYNDEVNTFRHVIEALMEVCDFDETRAGYHMFIAHEQGNSILLSGPKGPLEEKAEKLREWKLDARVE